MEPTKSFASLSPSLLARKGGARPAMRPVTQIACYGDGLARDINSDLGWDDFGPDAHEMADPVDTATVVKINRDAVETQVPPVPAVVHQRNAAAKRVATSAAPKAKPRQSALAAGRKAAFTLRLDAERHFKLRLACAVDATSAQKLVIGALDRLLEEMPELADLAGKAAKRRKS